MLWAFIGALLIGTLLGLLGSGGSILTVPVLVYLVGEPEKLAIAESLGIVSLVAFAGAVPFVRRQQVDWRSMFLFGIPGMAGAYAGAYLSRFIPGPVQLGLLSIVMLLAAAMLVNRSGQRAGKDARAPYRPWQLSVTGLAVGLLTGLVGVGGGFLIAPALVIVGHLSVRRAIGTSLSLIAIQSATSFWKYLTLLPALGLSINWTIVGVFTALGIFGTLLGSRFGRLVSPAALKSGFATFLVVMGVYILYRNVPALLSPQGPTNLIQMAEQYTSTRIPQ